MAGQNVADVGQMSATGVVLVRTANGIRPATLDGVVLGGTADTPVLSAMPKKTPTQEYTASLTAILGNAEALVRMNSTSATTFTLPANANVAFPINTRIDVQMANTGAVTIGAASGVTIENTNRRLTTQYSAVSIIKINTDTWTLIGPVVA